MKTHVGIQGQFQERVTRVIAQGSAVKGAHTWFKALLSPIWNEFLIILIKGAPIFIFH